MFMFRSIPVLRRTSSSCRQLSAISKRNIEVFRGSSDQIRIYEDVSLASDKTYPSVTSILDYTMPAWKVRVLEKWRKNLEAEHGCKDLANQQRQNIRDRGTHLHLLIERHLQHEPLNIDAVPNHLKKDVAMFWQSVRPLLDDISDVKFLERSFICERYGYAGTIDCVARYKGTLAVIDWKTTSKPKRTVKSLGDYALQIAAYRQAVIDLEQFDEPLCAVIVMANLSGKPGNAIVLDADTCDEFQNQFLDRLDFFTRLLPNRFG